MKNQQIFNSARVINLCFVLCNNSEFKTRHVKSVKMTRKNNSNQFPYFLTFENKVNKLRRVNILVLNFRNGSGKTVAEVEIIFGQHVQMSAFILLYKELYENRTLGNMSVTPISDNSKYIPCYNNAYR